MNKMEKEAYRQIYDREPLYCKVRTHLCHQDQTADWDDLNKKYNELMSQVRCGLDLPMPDHVYVLNLIRHDLSQACKIRISGRESDIRHKHCSYNKNVTKMKCFLLL